MAILKKDGVELKCKRCKRLVFIPFSSLNLYEGSDLSTGSALEVDRPYVLPRHRS